MTSLEEIAKPIASDLQEFNRQFRQSLKSKVFLLNLITRYVLKTKGKQIRPILVLLSAKVFGEIGRKTYAAASLVELLHTTSLVHDDVVDEAEQRRGFISIHRLWNSKTAVLFGDYLLAQGLLQSVDTQSFDLLRIVSVAVREMCEGELLQLEHSRKQDITREDYFEVIRKKTATLMAACVEAGAQSTGASPEQLARMHEFGILLGMIFQVKDDLLDYQPAGITGKVAGNDLKEKKHTLPLIYLLEQLPKTERRQIVKMVDSPQPVGEKLKTITKLMQTYDSASHCYGVTREFARQALAILDEMPQNEATEALRKVVGYVTERKK